MPQWVRFLSCSFTGLLTALAGFFAAVDWYEGTPGYWSSLTDWLGSGAFWSLAGLFGLLVAVALVVARVLVRVYGLPGATAGLASGAVVALIYAFFLVASHAGNWGGWAAGAARGLPSALVFAAPFALSGALAAWLWDRLA